MTPMPLEWRLLDAADPYRRNEPTYAEFQKLKMEYQREVKGRERAEARARDREPLRHAGKSNAAWLERELARVTT